MKQLWKFFVIALALTAVLSRGALAAGGLDSFAETRELTADTFPDVQPRDWFYNGVKVSYDLGIFSGMPGGIFLPNGTVNWDQAVTLAARVRAGYLGEEIPAAPGLWYAPYGVYAQSCGILPADCPAMEQWSTTPIDRQSLAYLFQAVVGPRDCPPVSDLVIPDLDRVEPDKREAVQSLYTAGIFTGKSGGSFDPTGKATRAELATIISRLLRPAYRISHDSRANRAMFGQESNLTQGGVLYHTDGADYLLFRDSAQADGGRDSLLRRDAATGMATAIYTAPEENTLSLLWGQGEWIYFQESDRAASACFLRRMSLAGGQPETVCTYPLKNSLKYAAFYDGRIFVLWTRYDGKFHTEVGEVVNGSIRKLKTFSNQLGESLYGHNGKLYILADYGKTLISYDLAAKTFATHLQDMAANALYDGKIYYTLFIDGEFDPSGQVYMAALDATDKPVKYAALPADALVLYPAMNHNGKALYYLGSGSRKLYKLTAGLEAELVLTNLWGASENPILWGDCYLEGNPGLSAANYRGEYPLTTGLGTADQKTRNVDYWLGRSALMAPVSPPVTGGLFRGETQFGEGEVLMLRRIYYSGDELVLDLTYRNPDAKGERKLCGLDITLSDGDTLLADKVRVLHERYVGAGKTVQLTAIIRGDDLPVRDAPLTDPVWEISILQLH